jgi:hypothetical protein
MGAERLLDVFSLMERRGDIGTSHVALCVVAAEFVGLDGASIVLCGDDGEMTSLCASNDTARSLADAQIVAGEGPAVDACRGDTVNEPNLRDASVVRWGFFAPQAIAVGARAVFGYSICLGAVRIGALTLFRLSPGPLVGPQEADAFLMATVIGRAILAYEAGGPDGGLVGELDGASRLDFTVHQAAGMVAVQGSISVRDALVSLRAHAFATDTRLSALAGRVVTRETRFDPRSRGWRDDSDGAGYERVKFHG